MFKYLVAFVLLSPLVGLWRIEHGAMAYSIGVVGHENGAMAAFFLYAFVLAVTAWLASTPRARRRRRSAWIAEAPHTPEQAARARRDFRYFSTLLLVFNAGMLALMLFGYGGVQVWLGEVNKGAFRTSLGPLGGFAFYITKFALPALFAYATVLLMRTRVAPMRAFTWQANLLLVFLIGSTWGFKSTGLFMLLPAFLITNWRLSVLKSAWLGLVALGLLFAFFMLYDARGENSFEAFQFLFDRLTIFQGDVSWYIWDLHARGAEFPPYAPTLLAAFGDSALAAFGVAREDHVAWMLYHYDWMVTHLSGFPLDKIANGHSVTATPFTEGLIAGGSAGPLVFAALGGVLVGRIHYWLDRAVARQRPMAAAMLATYFCFNVFSWLNGGAVTQLFHISTIAYLVATFVLLRALSSDFLRGAEERG